MNMTQNEVRTIGNRVLKQLPKGWKVSVYENLGWHVSWINGALSLHYSEYDQKKTRPFWTLVGPVNSGVGHIDLCSRHSRMFKNPRQAVMAALKEAKEFIRTTWEPIIHSLNQIERSFKES